METNNLEGTLVTQLFLELVVSGVKPLLNPQGITLDTPGYLFKVGLNSHLTDITFPLYINVNGLSSVENSHLQFKGQLLLATEDLLIGLNSGSTRVNQIAYSNTNPLNLYFILDEHVTSFSVEVLSSAYKENLVSTISVENPDDIEQYLDNEDATVLTVVEDSTFEGYVFKYVDKTGEGHFVPSWYTPAPGEIITTVDSVKEAGTAERAEVAENLDHDVTVNIVSDPNSLVTMTGTGVIESDLTTSTLTINATNLNLPEQNIPLATTTKIGGIKLYGSEDAGYNNFPVQLSNEKAYVHVPLGDMDIHRYKNLAAVPNPKVGDIVQYIGNTTSQYTNGYFYQYWPTSFTVDPIPNDSTWYALSGMADVIKAYNTTINYSLVPGIGINISLVDESDSDASEGEVLFAVSLGSYTIDMTYEEIQQNLGILLKNGYTVWDASDLTIYWRVAEGSTGIWIQKNVLPLILMQSALVYKGTVQNKAALLELTPTAQKGDFYTVIDPANQEWFFNGTITSDWEDSWEYMGEVFALPIASSSTLGGIKVGTNLSINSSTGVLSATGYTDRGNGRIDVEKNVYHSCHYVNNPASDTIILGDEPKYIFIYLGPQLLGTTYYIDVNRSSGGAPSPGTYTMAEYVVRIYNGTGLNIKVKLINSATAASQIVNMWHSDLLSTGVSLANLKTAEMCMTDWGPGPGLTVNGGISV